jgi:hypothetical protein
MEIIPVVAPNPISAPKAPVSDSGIFDPIAWEYAWFRHLDIKLDSLTTLVNQVLFLLSKSAGMTKEDVKTVVATLDGIRKSLQAVSPLSPSKENAMAHQPQKQVPTELQAGLDALKAEASKAAQTITDQEGTD